MTVMIKDVSAPVTINREPALVVAVGGGVVSDPYPAFVHSMYLCCPTCGQRYPMARDPRALALSPAGATVLPGYAEMCPYPNERNKYHEHGPGTVIEVA